MKPTTPLPAFLLLATFLLAGIISPHRANGSETVIVSGKTVYLGMGVEEAEITADNGKEVFKGKSGYHGSFLLHLPAGTYELKAMFALPGVGLISGLIPSLVVSPGIQRLDKTVIEMGPQPRE